VAWDLSGVFTEEAAHEIGDFATHCDLTTDVWRGVFQQYCDVERAWDRVECGDSTLFAFAEELVRRIGAAGGRCDIPRAMKLWGEPDPFTAAKCVRPEVMTLARTIRAAGLLTCVCTNNVAEWRPAWQALVPPAAYFDYVFDSSEMGVRKPERAFFERVETQTGCSGSEIFFIDDRSENVFAAAAHGWATWRFTGDAAGLRIAANSLLHIR
jgi:FMN phosphatase YigB (HAD superfamily)